MDQRRLRRSITLLIDLCKKFGGLCYTHIFLGEGQVPFRPTSLCKCRRRKISQPDGASLALCDPMCDIMHMATNVEIDPELIKAALSLGGKRSKRAVIDEALREYVLRRQQRDVIKLFGSIDYDESYDYKKQRSRR